MKLLAKIGCLFMLLLVLTPVLILSYLGFVPGLSSLFGSDKPRDLGVSYAERDRVSARTKSQIEYTQLPNDTLPQNDRQLIGSRQVTTEWTSAEMTALINNRPWRYHPYKNVQLKFNADGSGEISGVFIKDRLYGYGTHIGVPTQVLDFTRKFMPADPVFYVKGKAALTDNKISVFEPMQFEIGRMSLPVGMFLAFAPPELIGRIYAQNPQDMAGELSKVQNKRALIISFINQRLSQLNGFYAKKAYFTQDKVIFDGTLPEKIATTR